MRPEGLAARVRLLREARGWTQQELAGRAGVSQAAVARMEAGERGPLLTTAWRVGRALGVSLDELCGTRDQGGS